MSRSCSRPARAVLPALILAALGCSGSGTRARPVAPTPPPLVESFSPGDGARFVGRETPVVIRFGVDIAPVSIHQALFGVGTVTGLAETKITYDTATRILTAVPKEPWPFDRDWIVVLANVTFTDGRKLERLTWRFSTRLGLWTDEVELPAALDRPVDYDVVLGGGLGERVTAVALPRAAVGAVVAMDFEPATGWSAPSSAPAVGPFAAASVGFSPGGATEIVAARGGFVIGQHRDGDGRWGPEVVVSRDLPPRLGADLRVGIDEAGVATAAWIADLGTGPAVAAARRLDAWGSSQLLHGGRQLGAADGTVDLGVAAGAARVVWQSTAPDTAGIWSRPFAGGGWFGTQRLDTAGAVQFGGVATALDPDGTACVLWVERAGGEQRVVVRTATAQGALEEPEVLRVSTESDLGTPSIAVGAGGHAIATWSEVRGDRVDYWVSRRDPAGLWSESIALELAADLAAAARPVAAVVDRWGNLLVAWWGDVDVAATRLLRFAPGNGWWSTLRWRAHDVVLAVARSGRVHAVGRAADGYDRFVARVLQ